MQQFGWAREPEKSMVKVVGDSRIRTRVRADGLYAGVRTPPLFRISHTVYMELPVVRIRH